MNTEKTPTVEMVLAFLNKNKYEAFSTAYFVLMNGEDMGNEDFCENCIDEEVKAAKGMNQKNRDEIKTEFEAFIKTRIWRGKKVKEQYTDKQLLQEMRRRMKKYPAKAKFTYEGHDPDFGGGLTELKTCGNCGEYFDVYFAPDKGEAECMCGMSDYKNLDDRQKFWLSRGLEYYEYCKEDVQDMLDSLCSRIIIDNNIALSEAAI